jgi:hypothetical protein
MPFSPTAYVAPLEAATNPFNAAEKVDSFWHREASNHCGSTAILQPIRDFDLILFVAPDQNRRRIGMGNDRVFLYAFAKPGLARAFTLSKSYPSRVITAPFVEVSVHD